MRKKHWIRPVRDESIFVVTVPAPALEQGEPRIEIDGTLIETSATTKIVPTTGAVVENSLEGDSAASW